MLSILLPAYNNKCYALVQELQRQCEEYFYPKKEEGKEDIITKKEEGKEDIIQEKKEGKDTALYEIIVADDGSRDQVAIISNMLINELPHCRYIRRRENVGRSVIRNFLIDESKGDWVMLLDSDVDATRKDFISKYMDATLSDHRRPLSIYGGVEVTCYPLPHNLRYIYEKKAEASHTAEIRSKHPYRDFHTANILASRDIFAQCRFDERIKTYGYEDVIFGKKLKSIGVPVVHIDNPVGLNKHDKNEVYLKKVEESIRTLHAFRDDLRGTSPLLQLKERLERRHLLWTVRLWHMLFGKQERKNLLGTKPSLTVLKIYKLGYLARIK